MSRVEVAASILTADFGNLYRVVRKLERAGVDRFHLDVMDGHFVPNISFGPDVVAAVRRLTPRPIDVHLMIAQPSRYVDRFLAAGSDTITLHVEVDEPDELKRETLAQIRRAHRLPGLAVSPATPVTAVEPFLDMLWIVMIMTVQPGFGGQGFLGDSAPKIREARDLLSGQPRAAVHVDGGVNGDTAAVVGRYGPDVCVVGSALFQRGRDTAREVEQVRREAGRLSPVGVG
ncbi:MAG TPA: ribulose-phosphate 3-epimerase [Candidatus Caenarcaniphilales bacterium]|nr:ribulose-phosphate 3-epimerase [Candidatus Caenarcaniphilales bacterium]